MKINVMSHRKSTSCARLVPGSLELFRSPPLDALHLGGLCQGDVSDRHAVLSRRLPSLFGQTTGADLPIGGDFDFLQKIYEAVRAIRSASSFVRPPSSRSVTLPTCQTRVFAARRAWLSRKRPSRSWNMTTCGPWNHAPALPIFTRSTRVSPSITFSMYVCPVNSVSSRRTSDGVPQRRDTLPPGSDSFSQTLSGTRSGTSSHGARRFALSSETRRPRSSRPRAGTAGSFSTLTTLTFRSPSQSRIAERDWGTASTAAIAATTTTAIPIASGRRQNRGRSSLPRIAASRSGVGGKATSRPSARSAVSSSAIRLPEMLDRPRGARLDRAAPNVQRGGGLRLRELEEEAAGDHETLLLAQSVDRLQQPFAVFPRQHNALGGRSRVPRGFVDRDAERESRPASGGATAVASLVGDDPEQPRPKR